MAEILFGLHGVQRVQISRFRIIDEASLKAKATIDATAKRRSNNAKLRAEISGTVMAIVPPLG
jgi:hypothetical protein